MPAEGDLAGLTVSCTQCGRKLPEIQANMTPDGWLCSSCVPPSVTAAAGRDARRDARRGPARWWMRAAFALLAVGLVFGARTWLATGGFHAGSRGTYETWAYPAVFLIAGLLSLLVAGVLFALADRGDRSDP